MRARPILIAVAVIAAAVILVVVAPRLLDATARDFPVGACANFQGDPAGENYELGPADCAGPHTHIVTAWIPDRYTTCPDPATDQALTPRGTLCLRLDPAPSSTPSP